MGAVMKLAYICVIYYLHSCVASDCSVRKCVPKCCPENEYVARKKCVPHPEKKDFDRFPVYNAELKEVGHLKDFFDIKAGAFLDDSFRKVSYVYTILYKNYHLIENGVMVFERERTNEPEEFGPNEYCIDYKLTANNTFVDKVGVWFKNKPTKTSKESNHVTLKWGFLVSSVFLLLVLTVYCLLPELRNLGGLILMGYMASLMLGFIFLFTLQMSTDYNILNAEGCLSITSLTYFFLLASFCWLNVMSYDIWWTFRGYAKARAINRRGENAKFLAYCAYAFGVPAAMTIALVTLNVVNNKHRLPGIVPEIPTKGCFIEGWAKHAYLYAPMLIMIMMNWVFFLMTAFNIWRLSRGAEVLRAADSGASGSSSAQKNSKQRLMIYLKLSVLMGLSWILEVVSSFNPDFAGWYITDLYNVFIGVIIFIIFVCKKKVLRMLRKRYINFKHTHKHCFQPKRQTSSSQDESNTQSLPLQSSNPGSDPPKPLG